MISKCPPSYFRISKSLGCSLKQLCPSSSSLPQSNKIWLGQPQFCFFVQHNLVKNSKICKHFEPGSLVLNNQQAMPTSFLNSSMWNIFRDQMNIKESIFQKYSTDTISNTYTNQSTITKFHCMSLFLFIRLSFFAATEWLQSLNGAIYWLRHSSHVYVSTWIQMRLQLFWRLTVINWLNACISPSPIIRCKLKL